MKRGITFVAENVMQQGSEKKMDGKWLLILTVIVVSVVLGWMYRRLRGMMQREWRKVPAPNWACKRGWRDTW